MKGRLIPVDAKRGDWQRLVAKEINRLRRDMDLGNDISRAERVVQTTYGDIVSVDAKGKNLNKFGRNKAVGTSFETVAELQGATANETFVTTNIIDSIVSDNAGDTTQTITVEGHTVDGSGNLTFVTQDVALTGTTEATLSTPLARANRAFVKSSGTFGSTPAALAGNVYVYDNTGGISAGVPVTPAATKVMIIAGDTQSEKAATSISKGDYWFVSYLAGGVGNAGAASVDIITVQAQTRDVVNGGAWRPMAVELTISPGQNEIFVPLSPYLIVPKNHDWRIVAKTNANTAEVFAEAGGFLASIQ